MCLRRIPSQGRRREAAHRPGQPTRKYLARRGQLRFPLTPTEGRGSECLGRYLS